MKRIPTQENGFWKRFFINIPFVLLIALMIACFGGGSLFLFYSIVTLIAFHSSMIYMLVAGACAIAIGIGLMLIPVYQKYYAFYNKKMGWKFVEEKPRREKTVTYENNSARALLKKIFTLQNIAIFILAIGSLFAIISAALGCIDKSNWVRDMGGYREERGYYAQSMQEPIKFNINADGIGDKPINGISVSDEFDRNKKIIVIYSNQPDRRGFVEVTGYKNFKGDFSLSRQSDGRNDKVNIQIGEAPALNSTLDKLLFFVFKDYMAEKQILIYIPYSERNNISVENVDQYLLERENGSIEDYIPAQSN